ncbi:MAG: class I SAM-dependent methyltransferase [Reyranella sp.]|jgi:2-polyprenyl-3-methyl-5-hydroxy-6-metoxy-1,4-benzoquinol methylase|uniref:class I SAM-dependent methyltransferase n=1 Tax=Reyranella sp. TaxID=1929291 RepID=UPI0025D704BB|nr:class I SAM-dependent methyltransferase [Reyranella sp.]MBR2813179.1 class I SAM-dependent methyltransferase [Reyranella sp.]
MMSTTRGRKENRGANNRATVEAYDRYALDYARSTAEGGARQGHRALAQLLEVIEPDGNILEIGSGAGWDADWRLEKAGFRVRRTDAAMAFVRFQESRGVHAERLDVVQDDLTGPYDAVVALHVLQHIDRSALPAVLRKVSRALREGGAFLFSISEGRGDVVEQGASGQYYVAMWQQAELSEVLVPLGFRLQWSISDQDNEGSWLTMLVVKKGHDRKETVRPLAI